MLPFIQTEKGLSLILGGKMRTVSAEDPAYQEVLDAVKHGADEVAVSEILERNLNRVTEAVQNLVDQQITDDVSISGGLVMFRGEPVHNSLADRILAMLDEGFELTPMARFLENLMQNPSYRAVNDLYSFLEYGRMPITDDGCFLAYKAVRADFLDIHSGTIDNLIGQVVEMPRNRVDEDPNRTCSNGLHVCSFDYLPSFAHANGHVMICKINPRDVVAIPADYDNTKMRVCRYEVVGEHEGYYSEKSNVLSNTTVATEEEPFLVIVQGANPSTTRFARLSEASAFAEEAFDDWSTEKVIIKNGISNVVLDTLVNDELEDHGDAGEEDYSDEPDEEDDGRPSGLGEESDQPRNYEVVSGESLNDIEIGHYALHARDVTALSKAKAAALQVQEIYNDRIVQVRDQFTREVKLTLSSS